MVSTSWRANETIKRKKYFKDLKKSSCYDEKRKVITREREKKKFWIN